jgi:hypothetical protein
MLEALKSAPHLNDTKSEYNNVCVRKCIKRVLYNVCLTHIITRFYITCVSTEIFIYN